MGFWIFNERDEDGDRRMTLPELRKCLTLMGVRMSEGDATQKFREMDKNGGGVVLFDEFCQFMTMQSCPQAFRDALQLAASNAGLKCPEVAGINVLGAGVRCG